MLPTRLSRRGFYRQYVRLYVKTYSFLRYFRSVFGDLLSRVTRKGEPLLERVDRLSFLKLCLLHVVASPLAVKMRRVYKTEPLVSMKPVG